MRGKPGQQALPMKTRVTDLPWCKMILCSLCLAPSLSYHLLAEKETNPN